jgi:hypothetical protein
MPGRVAISTQFSGILRLAPVEIAPNLVGRFDRSRFSDENLYSLTRRIPPGHLAEGYPRKIARALVSQL